MWLYHLCDVSWRYGLMRSADPSPHRDGRLYGQGEATFTGRLAGLAPRSDYPGCAAARPSPRTAVSSN
jgi:hypothetical protein